jgi:hypothetical protein
MAAAARQRVQKYASRIVTFQRDLSRPVLVRCWELVRGGERQKHSV